MRKQIVIISILLLVGCANKITTDSYKGKKVSEIFNEGLNKLDKGEYDVATIAFKSIDDLYPYSATASTAQVYAAYCLYRSKKYQDSIRELEIFMKYNPVHELYAYAMYLRGLCFLQQICKVGRSQVETVKAKSIFIDLIEKFPHSDYAKESEKMLLKLDNMLAASEMNVAKFYQLIEKNLSAAAGRYSVVVSTFPHTDQAPEALYRMIECYMGLGFEEQADNVYKELHRLFKDNVWCKKAQKFYRK